MTKNELLAMVTMNEATRETASAMIDSKRDDLIASLVKLRKEWDKAIEEAFPKEVIDAVFKTLGYENDAGIDTFYNGNYCKIGFQKRNGSLGTWYKVSENSYTSIPFFQYHSKNNVLIVSFEKVYEASEHELARYADKINKANLYLNEFKKVVPQFYQKIAEKSKDKLEKRMEQLNTISKATETDSKPLKTYKIVIEVVEE